MLSKSPVSYIIELKYKLAIRHCFDIIAPKNIWQKWRDIKDMQENVRIIFKDNIKVVEINTIKFSGFTLPITNDKGEVIGKNSFRGRMVIRCTTGNKLYLYHIYYFLLA